MSKLDELIKQYCPDGVKFVKLGEVCSLSRGKVFSKKYLEQHPGNYPVYSSQTANNGEFGRIDTYDYDGDYLTWTTDGAYAGTVFYRKGKFSITNVCGLIKVESSNLNLRFLYYWLTLVAKDYVYAGMGNPKLMSNQVAPIEIPLPPLAIQSRIVEILDNFSSLTAELQAELQARRSQYEYYRNHLLSFDGYDNIQNENNTNTNNSAAAQGKTVKWVKLGEVCNDKLERISSQLLNSGNYTSVENLIKNRSGRIDAENVPSEGSFIKYNKEDILIGNIRPYLKKIWFADKVGGTNGDVIVIQVCDNYSDTIDKRYLFQVLSSDKFFDYDNNFAKGGKMPRGDKSAIKNFPIPLPSLSEQRRIADILDRFEALTTDLQCGLPAEIEARQQQYEYYRNKLLTFEPKK